MGITRVIHDNVWNDRLHAIAFVGRNVILEKSLDPKTKYTDIDITYDEFYKIAIATETDKVRKHKYHHMYAKYLPLKKMTTKKVFEVGLGCNMEYGPGESSEIWGHYFPH